MGATWMDEDKVSEYAARVGRLAPRLAGESELLDVLPETLHRVLDLGCGDGRLISLVADAHDEMTEAVGLDRSLPMLERARARFAGDDRTSIADHDLNQPLPALGQFDAVVSGFAIHHLPHERKQLLFGEIVECLRPGGTFTNLEVVQCATPELHDEFQRRIGREAGDPEDVLAAVEPQLEWMRAAGLVQVDCYWRWRGFALLVGRAPGACQPDPVG